MCVYACVSVCESSMCIRVTIAQVIHCTDFKDGNESESRLLHRAPP